MNARISESDLAALILPHALSDFQTWIALSKVSKKFNEVSKMMLVRKEIYKDGMKGIWTELPSGQKHGHYREWYPNGQLKYSSNFSYDQIHGQQQGWFMNGQLSYILNIDHGEKHGFQQGWRENGQLAYTNHYDQGQLIEKSNN